MADVLNAPLGERVSTLERGDKETSDNVRRLERKLDDALEKLGGIQMILSQRRGSERVAVWLLEGSRMLGTALIGTVLLHFWSAR